MDAVGRKQGQRSDLMGKERQDTAQEIADLSNESKRNVFRYLRLNSLIPPLLQRVDEKSISVEAGGNLSLLRPEEQERLEQILTDEEIKKVTPKQAAEMSEQSQQGELSEYDIECCLNLHKENPLTLSIKLNVDGIISEDECKWMKKKFRQRGKDKLFVKCLIETLRKEVNQ
jgi:ParB family chromosome partitioning protein